ncbi:MAG: helix-turn-helix transcriptional regulator [Anaerolineaceae bacterium]|nr:helix-turn-helix transcriptional regulator [Anaerolineaceae bacterium]
MVEKLYESLNKPTLPNKFTLFMGEMIRITRIEMKMSQAELGKKTYLRQATISDIEKGKREVSSGELVFICISLQKPASYFYPEPYKKIISPGDEMREAEEVLLALARKLDGEDWERLKLIAKAFVERDV